LRFFLISAETILRGARVIVSFLFGVIRRAIRKIRSPLIRGHISAAAIAAASAGQYNNTVLYDDRAPHHHIREKQRDAENRIRCMLAFGEFNYFFS
jgi:hypothetical protein